MAKDAIGAAFHEVYTDEPSIVGKTREKFGAERAKKQKVAIALSKARKAGAKIPKKAMGGSMGSSRFAGYSPRALGALPPRVRGMAMRRYAEGGPVLGGQGLIRKRQDYDQYVIDMQSEGNAPLPFADWLRGQRPMAGQVPEAAEAAPVVDPFAKISTTVLEAVKKGLPPDPVEATIRALKRNYADGGRVDTELFDPSYYRSDLIPEATAEMAARGAQERALRRAMQAGTTADDRVRQARLRELIARLRGGLPMAGELPVVGSRAELLERTRSFAQGGPVGPIAEHMEQEPFETPAEEAAEGMTLHHVDPESTGGFTHETTEDVYTYQGGGAVLKDILQALKNRLAQSTNPLERSALFRQISDLTGGQRFANGGSVQPQGALAQLGQQLLQERTALQNAYQIPPPASMPASPTLPTAQGLVSQRPTMVSQGLQNRMVPQFQMGGPVSSRLVRMAARNPMLGMRIGRGMRTM